MVEIGRVMKYYVYELIDPRNKKPFYVGTGVGIPISESFLEDVDVSRFTKVLIEEIRSEGEDVGFHLIEKNLDIKNAALLQDSLIKKYGRRTKDINGILTNGKISKSAWNENKKTQYATIQVRREIKDQMKEYCDRHGLFISKYVETIFQNNISGSRI